MMPTSVAAAWACLCTAVDSRAAAICSEIIHEFVPMIAVPLFVLWGIYLSNREQYCFSVKRSKMLCPRGCYLLSVHVFYVSYCPL